MPRTRDIRPAFFKHPELGMLPPLARLLFAGLWCHADREGRLKDKPALLQIEILPYDSCDVDELLNFLSETIGDDGEPFIYRYEIDGSRYIQIVKFSQNQRIHPAEKNSTIPARGAKNAAKQRQVSDKSVCKSAMPSMPSMPTGITPPTPPGGGVFAYPLKFESFWKKFPRKENKFKAFEKWKRLKLDGDYDVVMQGLEKWLKSEQWMRGVIPHATTWLNQRRWTDEPYCKPQVQACRDNRAIIRTQQIDYGPGGIYQC